MRDITSIYLHLQMDEQPNIDSCFRFMTLEQFENSYEEEETLGRGASSFVRKYKDLENNRTVAIKQLKKQVIKYFPNTVVRETRTKDLVHDNLMQIYDCLLVERYHRKEYMLVTEYCSKGTLQDEISNIRNMESYRIYELCLQLAKGLEYLHSKQIMHRDLKPENIFATENEEGKIKLKIGDFGSSKVESVLNTEYIGTRLYADPETESSGKYSKKCDIYSLGLIFYYLLFGKHLFAGFLSVGKFQFENKKRQLFSYSESLFPEETEDFVKYIVLVCLKKESEREPLQNIIDLLEEQVQKKKKEKPNVDKKRNDIPNPEQIPEVSMKKATVPGEAKVEKENIEKAVFEQKNKKKGSSFITNKSTSQFSEPNTESVLIARFSKKESIFKNKQANFLSKTLNYQNKLGVRKKEIIKKNYLKKVQSFRQWSQKLKKVDFLNDQKLQKDEKELCKLLILILNFMFLSEWKKEHIRKGDQLENSVIVFLEKLKKTIKLFYENVEDKMDLYSPEIPPRLMNTIKNYQSINYSSSQIYFVEYVERVVGKKEELNFLLHPTI